MYVNIKIDGKLDRWIYRYTHVYPYNLLTSSTAVPRYIPAWFPKLERPICSANMDPSTLGGQSLAEKMKKAMSVHEG